MQTTLLYAASALGALTNRYRARVAYDGTAYTGMQLQPDTPTISGTVAKALVRRCSLADVRVVGASRTDSGVHARGQVRM